MEPSAQHNDLTKMYAMWESGALPRAAGFHQISIYHDDDCGIFEGQRCHCDPAICLKATVPGVMN